MDQVMEFLGITLAKMGARFSQLTPELHLEDDLALESLMRVELATKLQRKFGKPVTDHIDRFATVGDIVAFLTVEPAAATAPRR